MTDHTDVPRGEPVRGATLKEMFERALTYNRSRTAVVFGDTSLTFGELDERSLSVAASLWNRGVRPGDRVAILMRNRPDYPVWVMAVFRLGAVMVPLNEMLAADGITYMVDHSGAVVVAVGPELVDVARRARQGFANDVTIVQIPDGEVGLEPGATWVDDLPRTSEDREAVRDAQVDPDDGAAIFYTGGTTGKPKGVLHTQRSLVQNQLAHLIESEILRDERLLLTTPLPHAAGVFLQTSILRGATAHVLPAFEPAAVLDVIEEQAITWTFAVPTMIYRLLGAPGIDERDLSSLRTVVYGAAPITPDRLREALDVFGPVFVQLYGQTECPNWATRLSKQDHVAGLENEDVLGSCGQPVIMADVRIVDENGGDVPTGEVGEIALHAPYVLDRYWRDEDATREKFVEPGWIRTGDVGLMDDAGYVHLKDRRADMVISGGMNVYTTEVEDVLQECPGVVEVAVIGIPDDDWGEAVHAVIVPQDAALTEEDILRFCRDRLASYMRPKSVGFVDEIPVTAYGKMDKKALRAPYWADHERQIH